MFATAFDAHVQRPVGAISTPNAQTQEEGIVSNNGIGSFIASLTPNTRGDKLAMAAGLSHSAQQNARFTVAIASL